MFRFKVSLETFTPIHIGCGEEYYPFEYFVDDKEKKLFVIDENSFLDRVESEGKLDEFTKLASSYTKTNDSLLGFIKRLADDSYRYSVDIEHSAFGYITKQTAAFRAGISKFIRNRYYDNVYIPGSTIKGALRNAVIDFFMRRLEMRFKDEDSEEKIDRKTLLRRVREDCYKLDDFLSMDEQGNFAQKDIMKFVKVSDFLPVGDIKQKVYKVFSIGKPKNDIRDIKNIPDILECVDRKSKFEGEIAVYPQFLENLNKILKNFQLKPFKNNISEKTLSTWMKQVYVNRVYLWEDSYFDFAADVKVVGGEGYHNSYSDKLKNFKLVKVEENMFYVKLGKHGGAVSKTIEGCRQIKIKIGNTGESKIGKHQSTLWLAGGYPMGWLKGKIEKIN